jgi:hypothetical protein
MKLKYILKTEQEIVEWNQVAQDSDEWWAILSLSILWFVEMGEIFLARLMTINC